MFPYGHNGAFVSLPLRNSYLFGSISYSTFLILFNSGFIVPCFGLALPLTCRRFTKLRIFNTVDYKYRQNLVSKITNSDKSQTPQFRETAVGGCTSFPPLNYNINEVKRFLIAVAIILLAVAIFLLVD